MAFAQTQRDDCRHDLRQYIDVSDKAGDWIEVGVHPGKKLYEVKSGRSGPLDFLWFAKSLPKRTVLAIGNGEFQSAVVKGITIEQFLLADGFPHPYPGQVDDPDIYNDYGRFF